MVIGTYDNILHTPDSPLECCSCYSFLLKKSEILAYQVMVDYKDHNNIITLRDISHTCHPIHIFTVTTLIEQLISRIVQRETTF